jgi:hypothetical protein
MKDTKLTKGFYFAPDPRPSANDDVVIYECQFCRMNLTRRKGDSMPMSTEPSPCPKNNGNHLWRKR